MNLMVYQFGNKITQRKELFQLISEQNILTTQFLVQYVPRTKILKGQTNLKIPNVT